MAVIDRWQIPVGADELNSVYVASRVLIRLWRLVIGGGSMHKPSKGRYGKWAACIGLPSLPQGRDDFSALTAVFGLRISSLIFRNNLPLLNWWILMCQWNHLFFRSHHPSQPYYYFCFYKMSLSQARIKEQNMGHSKFKSVASSCTPQSQAKGWQFFLWTSEGVMTVWWE